MSIQSSSVVQKMIDRLVNIKSEVDQNPSSSKVKEELSAVKAYCDLLMETSNDNTSEKPTVRSIKSGSEPREQQSVQNWPSNNSSKLNGEEDNGDSIFDF
ncbi:YwdI family protein [Pseudalkalibacillus decolorationis]|uniref:YwdI family protein n=1 Tax=Pseudalkalibacillus decolorationis TaxID=163879 RepID=UPI002147C545|nr:YwdI family protein [Pseudalkalibacillus decolorationis]